MNQKKSESKSFDKITELYDEIRPLYPKELIRDIIKFSGIPKNGNILEIGSGTGQATLPFAKEHYQILCIEPGKNLINFTKNKLSLYKNIKYINDTFENWSEEKKFDLIISAQAFHWIPPEIGYPKCANALKKDGYIAFFWNLTEHDRDPIFQELNILYKKVAPELVEHIDITPEARERGLQEGIDEIDQSNLFGKVELKKYKWRKIYSYNDYIKLLNSFSDHNELPLSKKNMLFEGVKKIINKYGGTINKPYIAVLYLAKKKQ